MKYNILINYAIEDNTPMENNERHWVENFIHNVNMMFEQVTDEEIEVIPKNQNDDIEPAQFGKLSAMISIVSNDYVEHQKLRKNETDFINALKNSGKNYNPVFYIFKNKIEGSKLPDPVSQKYYPMYLSNDDETESEEVKDLYMRDAEKYYWMKLVDLVYDIHEYLTGISGGKMKVMRPDDKNKTVFLAETTSDISTERNILKRELQRHGYTVIPEGPLPDDIHEFQNAIGRLLKESDFSIHLVGKNYGKVPAGTDLSIVESQYRLASDWAKNLSESHEHNFESYRRMVWIAPEQKNLDSKHELFLENIRRDFTTTDGIDIIETSLEDFKNMIREELYDSGQMKFISRKDVIDAVNEKRSVYLIYNQNTPDNLDKIKKEIISKSLEILEPDFKSDVLTMRYRHLENLVKMDYALIVQGIASDEWTRIKLLDVFKSPGYGRIKPIQNIGLITEKDLDLSNSGLPDQHVEVIKDNSKKLKESLDSFLERKQEAI